jgi:hypothetical protein
MVAPNQANFQTSQNFKIEIDKIYSDFIGEIDSNRSLVNISQSRVLDKFSVQNINNLNRLLKIEDTPQESRVHCFYRLIGFPVVGNDNSYYNPGFDNIPGTKRISLQRKIEIANNPLNGFKNYSVARENFINDIQQVWAGRPATITASALALSSSVHTRPFEASSKSLESGDPFKFSAQDQSYVADFRSIIGKNNTVLLTSYVDGLGNKPDPLKMIPQRSHMIKPFVVDARIDFSCNPASRKIAVPFVEDKSNLLIAEDTFIKRPLIEKIIKERFTVYNQNQNSAAQQKIQDFVLQIPSVQDQEIIKQMSTDKYKVDQRVQFQKYLYIIAAMCKELVTAQLKIKTVQSRYYWIPLPSTSGPEGGSEVADVIISTFLPDGDNNSFITEADRAIIKASLNQASNDFNPQTDEASGTPDNPTFALGNDPFTSFDPSTTQALGDQVATEFKRLLKMRNHDLSIANKSLRTIEIIMGEFSGLGLCDIVAVMGALYVMPANSLLGFLDEDAFQRALDTPGLAVPTFENPGIIQAHTDFIATLKDFYNLMDSIYKELDKNNGLST